MWKYVSSFVGASATDPPCEVVNRTQYEAWGKWLVQDATVKQQRKPTTTNSGSANTEESTPVSLFTLRANDTKADEWIAAKNCIKRLRTVRHPGILEYKDSRELPDGDSSGKPTIFLVTERVKPLLETLREINLPDGQIRNEHMAWGLSHIANALKFLSDGESGIVHADVRMRTVMATERLDWKLAGFDLASDIASGNILEPLSRLTRLIDKSHSPEGLEESAKSGLNAPLHSIDSWGLGCLTNEAFSGRHLTSRDQLGDMDAIPESMRDGYKALLQGKASKRGTPQSLIDSSHLFTSKQVETLRFLDNLTVKDQGDKEAFIRRLPPQCERLPHAVVANKVVPALGEAIELKVAPGNAMEPFLRIAETLTHEEFARKATPFITRLFASTDRDIRVSLLAHMHSIEPHIDEATAENHVYVCLCGGFSDESAHLRELTLRAVASVTHKLKRKTVSSDLLKHLSRLQMDSNAEIRANTTILIGNLAKQMGSATAKRVLANAFVRALKDPSPPAKCASLRALKATTMFYEVGEASSRILPSICPLCADPDDQVREAALETLDAILGLVRQRSNDYTNASERESMNSLGSISLDPETLSQLQQRQERESSLGVSSLQSSSSSLLAWATSITGRITSNTASNHTQPVNRDGQGQRQKQEGSQGRDSPTTATEASTEERGEQKGRINASASEAGKPEEEGKGWETGEDFEWKSEVGKGRGRERGKDEEELASSFEEKKASGDASEVGGREEKRRTNQVENAPRSKKEMGTRSAGHAKPLKLGATKKSNQPLGSSDWASLLNDEE